MGDALQTLLKKFAVVVGGDTSFDASTLENVVVPAALLGAAEQKHLPIIQQAIEERRELIIIYLKSGATKSDTHLIRPHLLRFIKRHWVLLNHDMSREGAQRTFVLKRIIDAQLTGVTFTRPKGFDPAKILAGNFGAYTGNEDHLIRIALRGPAAIDALENRWHESQTHTQSADGTVEITLRLNNLVEVKNDILRWGEHAEALEPPALREAVFQSLNAAAEIYRKAA
jgi:predicted DNA-binding transcriptional regulator YafY